MTQEHLELTCGYCHKRVPHFRALFEHYESAHKPYLKRYSVRHDNGRGIVQATSEDEACRFFGWIRKDCKVEEIKE